VTTDPLQHLRELRQAALDEEHRLPVASMLSSAGIKASWAKLTAGEEVEEVVLTVSMDGSADVSATVAAKVSEAVQRATALLVRQMRDPSREVRQLYRGDLDKAELIQRGQAGGSLIFEVKRQRSVTGQLAVQDQATQTERALHELVEVLPESEQDDSSLDAILGQRVPVRLAVAEIVSAATRSKGLHLTLRMPGSNAVSSVLSRAQAEVLHNSLDELTVHRTRRTLVGRLDGLRTRRRLFYLETDDGREITGGIEEDQVPAVQAALNQRVIATLQVTENRAVSGRRGREHFLLTSLEVQPELEAN
jgi:hypothetical protein